MPALHGAWRSQALMPERYVIPDQREAEQTFSVAHPWWKFSASFNVAPPRYVPVVRLHEGETEGVMLRWGLIPAWAEGRPLEGNTAFLPAERIERSDVSRASWENGQRCILPCAGFYAWQLTPAGYRQPYFVTLAGRPIFGLAGLWERSVTEEDDDVIESCAIITVAANSLIAEIDNRRRRMPVILRAEDHETWLRGTPAEARALLSAWPAQDMHAHPVSPRVNSLRYDDPGLIEPVG